jgi:hypothetical protein
MARVIADVRSHAQMDTSRYEAAVERNLAEMQRALLNLELMRGIEAAGPITGNEAIGTYYALFNDYIAHSIKVLENRGDAASFWYLYRTQQGPFDAAARELNIDLERISAMSARARQDALPHRSRRCAGPKGHLE